MRIAPEQSQAGRYRDRCRILRRSVEYNNLGQRNNSPFVEVCNPWCQIVQDSGDQQEFKDQQIAVRSYTISLRGRRTETINVGDKVEFTYRGQSEVCFIQSIVDSDLTRDELVMSVSSRSLPTGGAL